MTDNFYLNLEKLLLVIIMIKDNGIVYVNYVRNIKLEASDIIKSLLTRKLICGLF